LCVYSRGKNSVILEKQQLEDARTEIAKVANKKNYQLRYDPPKMVEEHGKRVVKPGYVSYKIN